MRVFGTSSICRPRMMPPKQRERAAHVGAEYCRGLVHRNGRIPGGSDLCDLVELHNVGQRFVYALPARVDRGFLMNRFGSVRDLRRSLGPDFRCAHGQTGEHGRPADQLASRRRDQFIRFFIVAPQGYLSTLSISEHRPKICSR